MVLYVMCCIYSRHGKRHSGLRAPPLKEVSLSFSDGRSPEPAVPLAHASACFWATRCCSSRSSTSTVLLAIDRSDLGCRSWPRALQIEHVRSPACTPPIPARTLPTLPRHSPPTLSVLPPRRFDVSLPRRGAELPPTASTPRLVMIRASTHEYEYEYADSWYSCPLE